MSTESRPAQSSGIWFLWLLAIGLAVGELAWWLVCRMLGPLG